MTVAEDYAGRLAGRSDVRGHLEFMHSAVTSRVRPAVIELGVRTGVSTSALLAGAIAASGQLWSCDIAEPGVPAAWHSEPRWTFVQGDDLAGDVQRRLPGQCHVLFIDTVHDYDHVLAELAAYVPRVRDGGVALVHDTQWGPGDEELAGPSGPVARALSDYCKTSGLSWENRPGSYGLGIIRL